MFNWIDWLVMGGYGSGLLGLTLFFRKKASEGIENYFLGGKQIPWWAMGVSGMAQQLDMTGTMIIVSLIFALGMRGLMIEVRGGLILLMAFAMVFQGKWCRRSGCMTNAEWMEYRFGRGKAGELARVISAISVIIMAVGALGVFMKGSGLFLSMFFPFSPLVCAIGLFLIATIYTTLTGFFGVVFTDLFQAGFIMLAVLIIGGIAFKMVPDGTEFAAMASEVSANDMWRSISLPAHVAMPERYKAFETFALTIVYYLVFTVFLGVSRSGGRNIYYGARNERECGTLSLLWVVTSAVRWPLIVGFVIMGVYLAKDMFPNADNLMQAVTLIKEYVPTVAAHTWEQVVSAIAAQPGDYAPELISQLKQLLGADWGEKIQMAGFYGKVNPEQVMPAVLIHCIPMGLRGLLFVALMAAAMSTFDSKLNESAAYFVRDIYQRILKPDATEKQLIRASHWTSVGIVVAAVFLGFFAKSINEIWNWLMIGLSGGVAMPGLLRWYWWRFNGHGFAGGTVAGIVAAIVQRIVAPELPTVIAFPAVLLVSLAGCLIGTFCSKPTDKETLDHFYKTTRPFGWWNPVRRHCDPQLVQFANRENRNDIIALFFAVPFQFLMYWTPVQFMLKEWTRFYAALAVLLISAVGLYWFWFRNLPKTNSNSFEEQA